jgi:hypothetical protein
VALPSRSTHGREQDNVETNHPDPSRTRADAINELFATLDDLMRTYWSVPDDELEDRLAADADLITGEIARRLSIARAAMPLTFPHPTV